MLCEQLIPTFIGLVMAYSALFILIGTMNPTPSDSLAIFLLELDRIRQNRWHTGSCLCLYGVCQPGAGGELLPPVWNARPDR